MDWDQKARENLLPLSQEREDLEIALKEWFYTGTGFDHTTPSQTCQLCENTGLRYHFEVKNKETEQTLLIGSSCILRFGIAVYGEQGQILEGKAREKKLSDKIRDFQLEAALEALRQLWKLDQENRDLIEDYAGGFKERGSFTPEQLLFLFRRLKKHHLDFEPAYYKLSLRSTWNKNQLVDMANDDLQLIWPSLSATQRKSYPTWKQARQKEIEQLEKERQKQAEAEQRHQAWLAKHQEAAANILADQRQPGSKQAEPYRATVNEQPTRAFGKKEAACVICGQITAEWWYYDGTTKTCKCNECKRLGKT